MRTRQLLLSPSTDFSNKAEDREVPETIESCAQKVGNMPVFEVTVTRIATVTSRVVVQADDESNAVGLAVQVADEWDFDTDETQIDSIAELTADEALEAEV